MIRLFDFLFSLLGLFFLFPVFILISIFIKFESNGPIFYKQQRVGRYKRFFKLIKFRSMYVDSEKHGLITVGNLDSRITKTGRFIRKYKLDELPQLINVLFGEMSLVGPRPEVEKYVKLYTPDQLRILEIRPGITDYASIYFSNENEILSTKEDPEEYYINVLIAEKIKLNLLYVNNYNLRIYLKIIFMTIVKIIRN